MAYGYITVENGFTVEGWFYRNSVPSTDWATIFTQKTQSNVKWLSGGGLGDIGRQIWFGCQATTGAFHFTTGHEGGGNLIAWTDPSPTGYQNDSQWHHFAITLDKETKRTFSIYLDGELYHQETTPTTAVVWFPGMLVFGGTFSLIRGERGTYAWDQRLAYCSVINHEITANRIMEHYTAGNGGTVYYGDNEVTRLRRLFEWSSLPVNNQVLQDATTTLQGIKVASSNALQEVQNTAEDSGGYLYADGQSAVQYHNRTHRYNRWKVGVFGENAGAAPEIGVVFTTNDEYIYNDVRGDRPYGTRIRLRNEESIRAYGRKVFEFNFAVTEHDEIYNYVTWIFNRYGKDKVRVRALEFACETSRILKDFAYSRIDIGDVIELNDLTAPAPRASMEFVVESVSVTADFLAKKWLLTVGLSPHEINSVFEIGTTKLGSENYVGY